MKKILLSFLIIALLFSCKRDNYQVTKITAKTNEVNPTILQDSSIIKTFTPYKKKMVAEITRVLSYAPENLVRTDGKLQSSLGNMLADLCYEKASEIFQEKTGKSIDFALFNYGGIRAGINKGEVTVANAFKLMPFENTLVVVELSYDKVRELFQYFLKNNKAHPLSKQIELRITGDRYSVQINGQPLQKSKTYYIVTTDYLQKGGDKMNFFKNPVSLFKSDYLMRDAIKGYFSSKDTLVSKVDNRVIVQ